MDIGSASSRSRRLLFGARTAKAILEVVCEQKNAFEVEGEDGMTTANERFRGGVPSNLYFLGKGFVKGHELFQKGETCNCKPDQERTAEGVIRYK